MADLTSTQLKLRTTPTAGVNSEQSPYYRRLLSAGYKGFLQGTVGGSTLYGVIGAGIGTLVALPLLPAVGIAALALVPAMGGLGLYKGAATFGNIGSFAAITAESAEMSEKRRYLLDRYYDLPDTPEFDAEAAQIRELLAKQHDSKPPEHMFHGKTVLVGAALGAAVALLCLLSPAGPAMGHFILEPVLEAAHLSIAAPGLMAGVAALTGSVIGALSGAMIGLDRYYVRSWLDKSAAVINDNRTIEQQIAEREQEISQLNAKQAAYRTLRNEAPAAMLQKVEQRAPEAPALARADHPGPAAETTRVEPISPTTIAGLDTPAATVSGAQLQSRVAEPTQHYAEL
jgi:hypothetical protein